MWLEKLLQPGVRRRTEQLYQQLDMLIQIRKEVRKDLLAESRKQPAHCVLEQIPRLGPIRVALLIGLLQTPYRFRSKRQLWAYCGLGLRTHASGEYRFCDGQLERRRRPPALRGLNENHNHELKHLFKSVTMQPNGSHDAFGTMYQSLVAKGMDPSLARLTLARKFAAIVLKLWKEGGRYHPKKVMRQTD
jgi:transposase